MSTAANKMRGGRNANKGRNGVYGIFKSQDEEQQPLASAASVDTSHDGEVSGAHVDSVMQHGEQPNREAGAMERVHDLTNMLEGTDLDEDHKKDHGADLDSSGLNFASSTAHMTLAQTPISSTLQNSFQVLPSAILADFFVIGPGPKPAAATPELLRPRPPAADASIDGRVALPIACHSVPGRPWWRRPHARASVQGKCLSNNVA